ncbi:sensor histidine kinase [Spirillospora sp. CA-294931]|uniref:sensor histidine kinase n=1 Tax=Spirillospora sp. CA-294931 TaxID=3240042 RepID=UPI003D8EF87D
MRWAFWRGRTVLDAVFAVALAVITASADAESANFSYFAWDPPLWARAVVGASVGGAVLARRRRPEVFAAAALVAFVVLSAWIVVVVAQYTLAERTASWRRVAAATAVAVGVVSVPLWRMGGPDASAPISLAVCVAPALLGLYVGTRRELLDSLRGRAERAEREQHERVMRARGDERSRIARDMHDVVTHRVALMVLHATALEASNGQDAVTAGRRIGSIGREALTELRSLVEVLRGEDRDAPLVPQPGLADLADLVAESGRTGLPVTFEMTGEAAPRPSALVEHAAYRVVQEALTNAHKHAGDARTRVVVRHTPRLLRLSVTNDAGTGTAGLPQGGHGLLGIAERVRLVGGELDARPTPDGGFEITATIPLTPEAAG